MEFCTSNYREVYNMYRDNNINRVREVSNNSFDDFIVNCEKFDDYIRRSEEKDLEHRMKLLNYANKFTRSKSTKVEKEPELVKIFNHIV